MELIDYVTNTPQNTNKTILKQLVNNEKSKAVYESVEELKHDGGIGYEENILLEIVNDTLNYDPYEQWYMRAFPEESRPVVGENYFISINGGVDRQYVLSEEMTDTYVDDSTGRVYNLLFGVDWVGGIVITANDGNREPINVVVKHNILIYHKIDENFLPKLVGRPEENFPDGEIFNSYEGSEKNSASECAHAEGRNTTASGYCSHAEGRNTAALGAFSHAEGENTTAQGHDSHAEGMNTNATGNSSHAEGSQTAASSSGSHAEGMNTNASGIGSHAEGAYTTASGQNSHAEGWDTVAQRRSQHVQGEYNILDTEGTDGSVKGKYAYIVGNGTSETARSNAHTLDWDGNAWFAGGIELTSPNGTRFRFMVTDEGQLSSVQLPKD